MNAPHSAQSRPNERPVRWVHGERGLIAKAFLVMIFYRTELFSP